MKTTEPDNGSLQANVTNLFFRVFSDDVLLAYVDHHLEKWQKQMALSEFHHKTDIDL